MDDRGDPNLAAPVLNTPQAEETDASSMNTTAHQGDTSLESINLFTQLGPIWDSVIFLVLFGLLFAGCNWFYRRAIDKEVAPIAPFITWNVVFCLGAGLLSCIFLIPHSGENAADFGDLLHKLNWLYVVLVAILVVAGCFVSTLNKDEHDPELN